VHARRRVSCRASRALRRRVGGCSRRRLSAERGSSCLTDGHLASGPAARGLDRQTRALVFRSVGFEQGKHGLCGVRGVRDGGLVFRVGNTHLSTSLAGICSHGHAETSQRWFTSPRGGRILHGFAASIRRYRLKLQSEIRAIWVSANEQECSCLRAEHPLHRQRSHGCRTDFAPRTHPASRESPVIVYAEVSAAIAIDSRSVRTEAFGALRALCGVELMSPNVARARMRRPARGISGWTLESTPTQASI
jgi:hypothetical protein